MVRITEQLIRKKSEHNELIIGSLEELSLHQEDIERIEHIQNWCRFLKILLLQSNLIGRIENVHRLKRLEYLNLALNNIERIENLEALESLQKLDLTLNFIGNLTDIEQLRANYNLTELILTGNPCADYEGYREYVITALPQLLSLDGVEITPTLRLAAGHGFDERRRRIVQLQAEYQMRRDEQKQRIRWQQERDREEYATLDEDAINEIFWKRSSEHCPETRCEISRQHRKINKLDETDAKQEPLKPPRFFAECGRPYNMNQAKLKFNLIDEPDRYELDLIVYKYLDTSLIEVDVQPNYVRATIKKKVFQMALNDEIRTSEASSKRSMTTGHLLIVMPKLKWTAEMATVNRERAKNKVKPTQDRKELVGSVDYKNIVANNKASAIGEVRKSDKLDFVDNPDVPPLI